MANSEIKVGIPRSAFFSCIGILVMALGTVVNNAYIDKIQQVNDKSDENRVLIKDLVIEAKADRKVMNRILAKIDSNLEINRGIKR